MNSKISLVPHPEARHVKHPKIAGVVLLVLAGFAAWLASQDYVLAVPLAVILLTAGVWNLRRQS